MYLEAYKRWMEADLEDAALKAELESIEGNEEEIKDRFAVALKFGTAGLRGILSSDHTLRSTRPWLKKPSRGRGRRIITNVLRYER